jgi:putative hydrolase of the HAD superfamily
MDIKTVAFDFGGVLTAPPFLGLESYAIELGLPSTFFNYFFRTDPKNHELLVGSITAREFFKYVCIETEARQGVRVDIRRLGAVTDNGADGILPVMADLVTEVRRRCRTVLVTNNAAGASWRRAFPFELFDHVLDSSEIGVRKPDPQIYRELIRVAGCGAEEIAFFDDFEENLPGAVELGITAVLFTDPQQCRAVLTDLGVLDHPHVVGGP